MKKNTFIAGALLLSLALVGCSNEPHAPAPGTTPTPGRTNGAPGVTTETGFVMPLSPRTVAKNVMEPQAKFAAEKVPLPPVADLESQIEAYIKKLDSDLEDLAETKNYAADAGSLVRDASALALIALGIGMSEEEGKLKKAAPGIVAAAQSVEKAVDLAGAKKAVADVKAALTSSGDPAKLGWTKIASLAPVMKAVPNIDANVKRNSNTEAKMKRPNAQAATLEGTAAMAVIVQGSMANYDETDKAGSAEDWQKLCVEFRDLAMKANAETRALVEGKSDFAKLTVSLEAMRKSCDNCHAVFHKSAIGQ